MLLFFLTFIFACMKENIIEHIYTVGEPGGAWIQVDSGGADRAWKNPNTGGVIYVDASCGQKFPDRSLEDSISLLLWGIESGKPLHKEEFKISDRRALYQVQDGEVDGVKVRLGMVVISKNECLFDFMLISDLEKYPEDEDHFLHTASSLVTGIAPGEPLPSVENPEGEK